MNCQLCAGAIVNDARYVDSMGVYACGACDAQNPWTSIKLTDVPALLRLLGTVMRGKQILGVDDGNAYDQLKELVCLKKI